VIQDAAHLVKLGCLLLRCPVLGIGMGWRWRGRERRNRKRAEWVAALEWCSGGGLTKRLL